MVTLVPYLANNRNRKKLENSSKLRILRNLKFLSKDINDEFKDRETDISKERYLNNLIQKVYIDDIPKEKHENNEYNALLSVPGSFKKIMVINRPFVSYTNDLGILVVSLEEFLLDKNSLNL